MNITPLIKYFIPLLEKNKLKNIKHPETNNIFCSLYKDFLEAEKTIDFKEYEPILHNPNEPLILQSSTRYFPKEIRTYINNTASSLFKYVSSVNKREININFYRFGGNNSNINKPLVKMMCVWLFICSKYSHKKCAETININIYLTPFKKSLPFNNTSILSTEHVNTAFTMACAPKGEITIFREEEWFKVFIHETFHSYGLEFGMHDALPFKKVLKKTFPIKSDFEANEAYTETWARIINCCLYSFYNLDNKLDIKTYLLYVDFSLQIERIFSIFQMSKVLNFMGLEYKQLYNLDENSHYKRQQLYKENTHVFGYYILTAVFLNDYSQFMTWCFNNNTGSNLKAFMKFNCNKESFHKMGDYFEAIYKNNNLLKTIDALRKIKIKIKDDYLHKTTRMAIFDISDL